MDTILLILIGIVIIYLLYKNYNNKTETFIEDREDGNTYITPSVRNKDVNISADKDINMKAKEIHITQGNVRVHNGTLLNKHNQPFIIKGMIMMWAGNVNDIPKGWAICDGQNETPDLRGRFIASFNNKESWTIGPKDTTFNGLVKLNINNLPAHNHSGNTKFTDTNHYHNGNTDSMNKNASHSHYYDDVFYSELDGSVDVGHGRGHDGQTDFDNKGHARGDWTRNADINHEHSFKTSTASSGYLHNHTIPSEGLNHSFDTRPHFYVLAFIMKL